MSDKDLYSDKMTLIIRYSDVVNLEVSYRTLSLVCMVILMLHSLTLWLHLTMSVQIDKIFGVYDNHLAMNKFLAGDFFSIADLNHLPRTAQVFGIEDANFKRLKSSRPNVERWWADISGRPSWETIVKAQKKAREVAVPQ